MACIGVIESEQEPDPCTYSCTIDEQWTTLRGLWLIAGSGEPRFPIYEPWARDGSPCEVGHRLHAERVLDWSH
jgi:hypothetical protein